MTGRCRWIWLGWLLLCLAACQRPPSSECFVRISEAADGEYVFPADFSDSLCRYDLFLYTRVDRNVWQFRSFPGVQLALNWESPTQVCYADTVLLCPSAVSHSSFFSQDFRLPYRADVAPFELGNWTIRARFLNDSDAIKGLRGLGLQVVRKPGEVQHGTR